MHVDIEVDVNVEDPVSMVESEELSSECSSENVGIYMMVSGSSRINIADLDVGVKGRLRSNSVYWEDVIKAPGPVLHEHYKARLYLPFVLLPEGKNF